MWLVNGTQRATFLLDIRNDLVLSEEITTPEGTTVETVTIPARAQYNRTRVQCVSLIIRGPSMESDNVTLTIQGICSLHLQLFANTLPVFTFCVSVCYPSARMHTMRVTVLCVFVCVSVIDILHYSLRRSQWDIPLALRQQGHY